MSRTIRSAPGIYRGTKSAETTLQISQVFELFGKRDARIAAGARRHRDVAAIQRKAVRLEVLSETAIAFLERARRAAAHPDPRRAGRRDRQADAAAAAPRRGRRLLAGRDRPRGGRVRPGEGRPRALRGDAGERPARACGADGRHRREVLRRSPAGSTPSGRPPSFQSVVAAIDANPQLVRWTAVYAQRNAELSDGAAEALSRRADRRGLAAFQRDQ